MRSMNKCLPCEYHQFLWTNSALYAIFVASCESLVFENFWLCKRDMVKFVFNGSKGMVEFLIDFCIIGNK